MNCARCDEPIPDDQFLCVTCAEESLKRDRARDGRWDDYYGELDQWGGADVAEPDVLIWEEHPVLASRRRTILRRLDVLLEAVERLNLRRAPIPRRVTRIARRQGVEVADGARGPVVHDAILAEQEKYVLRAEIPDPPPKKRSRRWADENIYSREEVA